MPVFQYEALDSQGVGIKDEVEALSQKEAISKIRNMGYFPTKVRIRGAAKKTAAKGPAKPKPRRGAGGKRIGTVKSHPGIFLLPADER